MSLFPAYSSVASSDENVSQKNESKTVEEESWLTNPSFTVPTGFASSSKITAELEYKKNDKTTVELNKRSSDSKPTERKHSKKEHKHSKRKKRSKALQSEHPPKTTQSEFTGKEQYYVDKIPDRRYMAKQTHDKTTCPKYRISLRRLGTLTAKQWYLLGHKSKEKCKRYFNRKTKREERRDNDSNEIESNNVDSKNYRLTEEEFAIKTKAFNRRLGENPSDIDHWLDFVQHQDNFYMKLTKLQLVERKLDVLCKALKENPANDQLYRVYVDIIEKNYPSFEVSKLLDTLLEKDPVNYILWNAQIMATQGSMARCNVPDVLQLYEKCMKNMYTRNRYDEVTLKLFSSCSFFLRQSGLYEQFFALITLALELNVNDLKFSNIKPVESDQNTLIEYEEVVLKSGLPMNEIWLRIEKLRQNYYFLPCPSDRTCSDPQRIVFNEDIYHYIYPLSNREYSFNLVIIILRMLKIPLPGHYAIKSGFLTTSRIGKEDNFSELDAIEEILPTFLYRTIFNSSASFDDILWQLIREFSVGPSIICTHIGHELYIKYLTEILLISAECFQQHNELSPKRKALILLWLKLERTIMLIDIQLNKWNDEKGKKLRSKIKNLLKRDENRNCLIFYAEYGQIEYDLNRFDVAECIFLTAIDQSNPLVDNDCTRAEYWFTCISYVEILLRERQKLKAQNFLTTLALDGKVLINNDALEQTCSEARNLLALKKLTDRLNDLCFIERNVEIMEIEQGFLPDYFLCVVKAKIYYLLLWSDANETPMQRLEILLKTFLSNNIRHQIIRENLYEIYVNVSLYINADPTQSTHISENIIYNLLCRALNEFPHNLLFLRCISTCDGQAWHRLRTILTKHNSPVAVIFLVAIAQYRYKKYANALIDQRPSENIHRFSYLHELSSGIKDIEITYKMRVSNLLKRMTSPDASTRRNSLLWRLYMRSLLDVGKDFDKSRNILYLALNECPWNKALYMDGTVYVPQELPHIQDLIIEKQMRIYAIPEELEILRDNSVQ